ncbi:asparagine synthase (glutamine-hydrolyzing) [Leptothrix discophora]|uniref:asparagine synthase (glutamine-hydrolyzing) n=1 Tax=Leptothrix discophora TaxID=89 RepID=A0ABT9G042_LEPDI|nr:asparagine synthase (glutamine-hydrolyzing) [Leptothrix discophora]MDP4299849.1 asparagine synthase (glutamine-hydrolyzing) [Leptothrix discophora]
MCGLTGWLAATPSDKPRPELDARLRHMNDALYLRGPDSEGLWQDPEAGIALAHRRLAIVDLSEAGHQPMTSASGRYVIAFNGEIYNHDDLREILTAMRFAPAWRGHSDTETLLAGFEAWGIEGTLTRLTGMFAIALWDRQERRLVLARDRLGEKPMYWGWQGGQAGQPRVFLFGSELKALQRHPAFAAEIDRDALALLLRHNYIGAPHSIFQGIRKLEPGTWLEVSRHSPDPVIRTYWSGLEAGLAGTRNRFEGSATEAVDHVELLLSASVGRQMMSDVPLGAFLSGGIDSSVVVALMQAQSSRPVRTFTIGFHEPGYNEATFAKAVAQHLGTDHTELYVQPQDALDVIPKLPEMYCEPFSDSSQIPTFLVSRMARKHVTVALSGDGGDELFCGYDRYRITAAVWHWLHVVPTPLRRWTASALRSLSVEQWNTVFRWLWTWKPADRRANNMGDKIHKGAALLGSRDLSALYRGMVSHWATPDQVVLSAREPTTLLNDLPPGLTELGDVERMMLLDLLTYLPGDVLTKVDRASMGVSLETRVPMLDHALVEFAWRLPLDLKLNAGVTKWPLRQVLYRHVPRELIERPKKGFAVPIAAWLRGPLKDWAEDLLSEQRLREGGHFDAVAVRRCWLEHLSGRRSWAGQLWDVLMFQAWLATQTRQVEH